MIAAVIGKGGVGKTTVTALLLRRLLAAGKGPVLAVDADPSACLGPVLGLRVERTLGELRDRARDDGARPPSMSKADWLALATEEAVVEAMGFDLLTMGHPEGPGCYCFVNTLLRDQLGRIARSYRHVLVDCEAGQEHLSRRTAQVPDALVCVVSRSRMAAETIRRALALFEALHERLPARVELVMNGFDPNEPLAADLAATAVGSRTVARAWHVPRDPAVAEHEGCGRSLLELPAGTPAIAAFGGWEEAAS